MSGDIEQEFYELIDEIRACRKENIAQTRSYVHQIFILAGAISAFLTPVFFLGNFSPWQHICLTFALVLLLGSIIFGVVSLSIVLGQEAIDLAKRQESLEDMKPETFLEISQQFKQYKYRRSHDLRDIILLGLFIFGVFLIMLGLVFGAWGL